jgi:phosphosulfolactate phosphohydrolase-like enzyme
VKVQIRNGFEPSLKDWIPDVRVVIDVFRASTTSLAILEKKPAKYQVANDLDLIRSLIDQSYKLVSEVFDLGIDNSPTLVEKHFAVGEKVVHKTTNLTTALEGNHFEGLTLVACFNNLQAVSDYIRKQQFANIEIIPAGQMGEKIAMWEDSLCAEMLQSSLISLTPAPHKDPFTFLGNWEEKKLTRKWPQHYIEDIELAVKLNVSELIPQVQKVDSNLFEVTSL